MQSAFLIEDIESVLEIIPSEEESKTLREYVNSGQQVEMLSEAERLAIELMNTDRAQVVDFSDDLEH